MAALDVLPPHALRSKIPFADQGGRAVPPKFPVPVNLAFLLRLGAFPTVIKDVVGERECDNAKLMATTTLKVSGFRPPPDGC